MPSRATRRSRKQLARFMRSQGKGIPVGATRRRVGKETKAPRRDGDSDFRPSAKRLDPADASVAAVASRRNRQVTAPGGTAASSATPTSPTRQRPGAPGQGNRRSGVKWRGTDANDCCGVLRRRSNGSKRGCRVWTGLMVEVLKRARGWEINDLY